MGVKRILINVIAVIFAFFLTVKFYLSLILALILGKLPLKVAQNIKHQNNGLKLKFQGNSQDHDFAKQQSNIQNCFQSVIDSCISLCLTATLVNYNDFLVKATFMICHHVHHSFLSLIYQTLPDYTKQFQDQYQYFLTWAFILFGFFGITTQIAFIMDLLYLLTLPNKLFYTLLRWVYSHSIRIMYKLYEFITTDKEKWFTCPYPQKYLTPQYRTSALIFLIILAQVTLFIVFYYLWLCLVMVGLYLIENTLLNLYSAFSLLGFAYCHIKNYPTVKTTRSIQNMFCSFLEPQTPLKILKGTNVFEKSNNQEQPQPKETKKYFSFHSLFQLFSTLSQNRQTS